MADSTVLDISKMKVVDLRKELKTRGLAYTGDKAELVARLQAAVAQEDHGELGLDSDLDSEGVLGDDDDKSQSDSALDETAEELALADRPKEISPVKPKLLKRKLTTETKDTKPEGGAKKIVLNRTSVTAVTPAKPTEEEKPAPSEVPETNNSRVKITADLDAKARLELRAKRFGLPVKSTVTTGMSDAERKEARKQRFGHGVGAVSTETTTISTAGTASLSENLDKLKKRAERFGQSVSKVMSEIEVKEKIEKRKQKFGLVN